MIYEFSAPMPFSQKNIDKLLDINNQVEKSKITNLYFGLSPSCELFTGFEQYRDLDIGEYKFSYWSNLMKYSIDKGIDIVYLLNSPKPLELLTDTLQKQLEILDKLLNEFQKIGVKKLRISNNKLLTHIKVNYPHFDLYASTSFDFRIIQEYQNFLSIHPYIKQIVPSHDINKNFMLLKNLKKHMPNVDIEIMVNEGCLMGCCLRKEHYSGMTCAETSKKNIYWNSAYYYRKACTTIRAKNPILNLCRSNSIYPYELEEYFKIGINKFKLNGRSYYKYNFENTINNFLVYLKGVDNIKLIENEPATILYQCSDFENKKIKDIYIYMPEIEYFKDFGHLCSSRCNIDCVYCNECAKKLEKFLNEVNNENI